MKHLIQTILISLTLGSASANDVEADSWLNCETFFAPSSLPGGGWGVYAARDFEANEIVEITPRFLPLPYKLPLIKNSVIDDYIYGYLRWHEDTREVEPLAALLFGKAMFYNHHMEPNVQWASYGREPLPKEPTLAMANGFVARRKIEAGEELFSSYGEEDAGKKWFNDRRMKQALIPTYASRKNGTVFEQDKEKFCSKIHAGFGKPGWEQRVLASVFTQFPYRMNIERLAPLDHPTAIVLQDVIAGSVLDVVPALVVSEEKVLDTAVSPMSFFWNDWDVAQKSSIIALRESGDILVQHQDKSTNWVRGDRFVSFDNLVVVPAAGSIALVRRLGQGIDDPSSTNCKLNIISSGSMKSNVNHGGGNGSAGILLELVATKDLKRGDQLLLNVPSNASPKEKTLLLEALKQTGQPVPDFLESGSDEDEL